MDRVIDPHNAPDEWAGILRDGEIILWQGRPDPGLYIHPSRRRTFTTGLLFTAFGLIFAFIGAAAAGLFFMLFSLLFVLAGLAIVAHGGPWPTYLRRHSYYTLTNQRAIIGIAVPWMERRLKTFDLDPKKAYELLPGTPGSIIFDYEDQGVEVNDEKQLYAVGFMRFAEAEKVWALIEDVRQANRAAR